MSLVGRNSCRWTAKAVNAPFTHTVTISVTVRMPNAFGCSDAGRRRGGKPNAGRTMPPKPSTPRPNACAVSVTHHCHTKVTQPCHNHLLNPKLRRRVVTQQKLFPKAPSALGQAVMLRPSRRVAVKHATAAKPVVRQCGACWTVNVSGNSVARSEVSVLANASTRPHERGVASRLTIET